MLKSAKIETSFQDDFLYIELIRLFEHVKLIQGATALNSSLRRHPIATQYLISKQSNKIHHIEETYFHEDGLLNMTAIDSYLQRKNALQNNSNIVN